MKNFTLEDQILFEDDDFFVVNKPPHVSTLDERHEADGASLLQLARDYVSTAQVGHRLDKETSGALIIAKHPDAYRHIAMQFEHRQITKFYHAVTNGVHDFRGVRVFLPIQPLRNGTVRIDRAEGKEAETIFNTLRAYRQHTLVECLPITGRMHQIRIHLACLDASIVQDGAYGGKSIYLSQIKRNFNLKKHTEEQPLIQRVALHAFALNFETMGGERVQIEAPYPKDMRALVTQLDKSL
ncbi:23S rRNA pseudouridine955/2504/2580 synthase [Catalinimonas alkaloidigena]|uniref:23S rRNA pseudouridine955/2504/2580 synthase n=1 Tax=Catalinimonas alkaloidigena TaxID=1075417 RepID=A0A1G8ZNC5_9BACT|nr:RluA family pseudouridine synthase [Catalinimonas alkaloidigena]SDK16503.1 23S rRNA pseudouridine955/2504/2580 synthase [Catalinimonas alkaloidigena]